MTVCVSHNWLTRFPALRPCGIYKGLSAFPGKSSLTTPLKSFSTQIPAIQLSLNTIITSQAYHSEVSRKKDGPSREVVECWDDPSAALAQQVGVAWPLGDEVDKALNYHKGWCLDMDCARRH